MNVNTEIFRTKDLIDEKTAASILGVTPGTLQVWRSTGRYAVPFIKIGRLVKYRASALNEWIESRTCASGTTAQITSNQLYLIKGAQNG